MSKIFFSFVLLLLSLTLSAQSDDTIYKLGEVDSLADFPDGIKAFNMIVLKNFRIPEMKNGLYKIFTSFIVEKDGSISDVKVTNSTDERLATESIRVVMSVKQKWLPAIKEGNPVRFAYAFPITISIK